MSKLIMTRGLPGSGKSHWSLERHQEDGSVIVNKDDIRLSLEITGWVWSPENEKTVILRRDQLIIAALKVGKNVISSDTNLAPKHETTLRAIATQCGAEFEVKDFTGVPVKLCIEWDATRTGKARVGANVINKMARDFKIGGEQLTPTFAPYVPDLSKPKAILVDLDGTLALFGGKRGPYDAAKCDQDDINEPVKAVVDAMILNGVKAIFVSGREDKYMEPTLKFLDRAGYSGWHLFMRRSGDYRKDSIVKGEILDTYIRNEYNILFALDDRPQVIQFWRSIGLFVFDCGSGKEF